MDEFSSQLLGHFTLALYCSSLTQPKSENSVSAAGGEDPKTSSMKPGTIAADEVPVLTAAWQLSRTRPTAA